MLNLGTGELLVILLIGLLIFGPNKLPEMARTVGRAIRSFQDEGRKAAATLRTAVEDQPSKVGVVDRPDPPAQPPSGEGASREGSDAPVAAEPAAEPPGADAGDAPPSRPPAPERDPGPPIDRDARLLEDT